MNDLHYPTHRLRIPQGPLDLFDDMLARTLGSSRAPSLLASFHPWRDNEDKTGYSWQILAAGLDPSDVSVELEDDMVVLQLKTPNSQKTVEVSLPPQAQKETLSANLAKGILTLSVAKKEKERKTIQIATTGQQSQDVTPRLGQAEDQED